MKWKNFNQKNRENWFNPIGSGYIPTVTAFINKSMSLFFIRFDPTLFSVVEFQENESIDFKAAFNFEAFESSACGSTYLL